MQITFLKYKILKIFFYQQIVALVEISIQMSKIVKSTFFDSAPMIHISSSYKLFNSHLSSLFHQKTSSPRYNTNSTFSVQYVVQDHIITSIYQS